MKGKNGDRNGNGNGKGQTAWAEQDRESREWKAGASGVGSGVWRTKRRMLVGDVLENRRFYEVGGAK